MESTTGVGLLLLLGLILVAPTSWTNDTNQSHIKVLDIVINKFNNWANKEYAFGILEIQPPPEWQEKICWGYFKADEKDFSIVATCKSQKSAEPRRTCRNIRKFHKKYCNWLFKKKSKGKHTQTPF